MPTIKITRHYTLPRSREDRGRSTVAPLNWDADDWRTPAEWAADELRDAGCTRHNWGPRFVTEEPKITDFSRGEEMTATAVLDGFTDAQIQAIISDLNS